MGFYYTIDDRGKVVLSRGTRITLANLRKQGLTPGEIGNAGLAAGENAQAVRAMVAYASRVRAEYGVNKYW